MKPTTTVRTTDIDMRTQTAANSQVIFWHRELPPLAAEALGEHVVEASSGRVSCTLAHRDEL